jgi:hypothetical protein
MRILILFVAQQVGFQTRQLHSQRAGAIMAVAPEERAFSERIPPPTPAAYYYPDLRGREPHAGSAGGA